MERSMRSIREMARKTGLLLMVVATLALSLPPGIAQAAGPAPVNLGLSGNFTILAKSGISNTGITTSIVGDIGVSPIGYAAVTGFTLTPTIPDGSNTFATSPRVTGKVYASDYTEPTPTNLTTAVLNMGTAYTDAATRPAGSGPNLNVGGGTLNGQNFVPGLYTWDGAGNVIITGDITLTGAASDVWIFQIPGTLDIAAGADIATGKKVLLVGGARASNVFWQVAGAVTLGTYSTFNGNILAFTNIAMNTGAVLNGRALAQTAVTLNASTVVKP